MTCPNSTATWEPPNVSQRHGAPMQETDVEVPS
jgi:hypothetical protein